MGEYCEIDTKDEDYGDVKWIELDVDGGLIAGRCEHVNMP
jgi:hypothetical protein